MDDYTDYRQAEVLTAREVQEILKVGNKTVYRLFAGACPFRFIKILLPCRDKETPLKSCVYARKSRLFGDDQPFYKKIRW